ncbi:hypothetical protein MPRF_42820 [Mycolicibacterium parafortuitum]|uniref:UvrD-like helicase ATP-binding domain-containing protein n=2 Tax=Mycolicibacterium parafortuitum TaxID=39692 RepID=A0A375YLV0_MYCPF|nr:hypothetical protein MPRF_42820 [Mycolicibacterium parafortuitum]SRX82110.1 hypothetical protein [Microlunatus phosphovorus NM-1] [Mycolicibacterium parafortuitum]
MKPLVTSANALRVLATGLAPEAVDASVDLHLSETDEAEYLVTANDDLETQRVVLIRDEGWTDKHTPADLARSRRSVLGRMASFVDRVKISGKLSLPRGWHQYKHGNLVAFFAVPRGASETRWIAEVLPGTRSDVVYWRTTTSDSKTTLEDFDLAGRPTLPDLEAQWNRVIQSATDFFEGQSSAADVDMYLPALSQSPTKGWSYDRWLEAISDDQRSFIDAPATSSIRLRGPAGSGKTLALTMKAIAEVLRARQVDQDIRVLVTTHSWSLATEISESIDSMSLGPLPEIDVFPLLEIAENISPAYASSVSTFTVLGEDSFSGKQAQLDEIMDVIDNFVEGDWVTYRAKASSELRSRLDSANEQDRSALAWDLLVEFGSVIGAAAIFPGAGSDTRYFQIPRAPWMLPLSSRADLEVVFLLYTRFMEGLEARSLMTSDQVLADFLSHLETHAWNRSRKDEGYDLVFVDEFHLFSPLERQVLHYLTRDVRSYPKIFMALDPRQSPSESFIGIAADHVQSSTNFAPEISFGEVTNLELTRIHRFTPQILELIKHIHLFFPTHNLGHEWDIDFSKVESTKDDGPIPTLTTSESHNSEETDIYRVIRDVYPHGRVALAVVDTRQWPRFTNLAHQISQSGRYHVASITGRGDVDGLGYRRRGLLVGPAEYLAGLQFETVIVAGIPDLQAPYVAPNEKSRLLSLLYLAISRAERDVMVFVNEEDGGAPEVLLQGISKRLIRGVRGSFV